MKRVYRVAPPIADFAPSPLARLFYRDISALEPSKDCTLSEFWETPLHFAALGKLPFMWCCLGEVPSLAIIVL